MRETSYHAVIAEMTVRSLWETQNVMDCIPDELWQRLYGGAPLWQHLYHALHSLDQWFINPKATDFVEPPIHTPHLQDLAIYPSACVDRAQMDEYEKLEHMPGIRPVPLVVKNLTVKFFTALEKKHVTAVISNMGRVTLPDAMKPYIKQFAAFSSCEDLFTCVASYGDDLVLGTASSHRSTNVLRRLYRGFAEAGLQVTLYATEVEK